MNKGKSKVKTAAVITISDKGSCGERVEKGVDKDGKSYCGLY